MSENKFKAGDKVVATSSVFGLTEGNTYTVRAEAFATGGNNEIRWIHLEELRNYCTADGSFGECHFDLAAPTFNVGDRVRIASDPNNGGFGEVGDSGIVQSTSQSDCLVKFETGSRSGESWYVAYKHLEPVAEQQQPLAIQAGKYYRTRDGRKVGPAKGPDEDGDYEVGGWNYYANGKFIGADRDYDGDLIAEWLGTHIKHTPAIVARLDNGQPLPATRPHVHASVADASKEATRLAKANPGREFAVYEMVHSVTEEPQHEWQRLAAQGLDESAASELAKLSGLDWDAAHRAILSL